MGRHESIQRHREAILAIAARHGARHVRLFGSVARRHEQPGSDIDLLVRFDADRSLLDHGSLIADLEDLLGGKVDVVSEAALTGRFSERVLSEAVEL